MNIQILLFVGENKKNQKHIFLLKNQLFLHFLLCKIVIGKNLKVLSFRKFFGSYLYGLILHAGLQIRCYGKHGESWSKEQSVVSDM